MIILYNFRALFSQDYCDNSLKLDRLFAAKRVLCTEKSAKQIVDKFLNTHIYFSSINKELTESMLKIYVDEFNYSHEYLMEDEVAFLYSTFFINNACVYRNDVISLSKDILKIDVILEEKILRAQSLRNSWIFDVDDLFNEYIDFLKHEQENKDKKSLVNNKPTTVSDLIKNQKIDFFLFLSKEDLGNRRYNKVLFENFCIHYKEYKERLERSFTINDNNKVLRRINRIAKSLISAGDAFSMMWFHNLGQPLFTMNFVCIVNSTKFYYPEIEVMPSVDGFIIHEVNNSVIKDGIVNIGDIILEVDDILIDKGMSITRFKTLFIGKKDTHVKLKLFSKERKEFFTVNIKRTVTISPVKITKNENNAVLSYSCFKSRNGERIMVISLKKFYVRSIEKNIYGKPHLVRQMCGDDIRDIITNEEQNGKIDAIVLDLRNNGGGDVASAQSLLGIFMGNKKICDLVSRKCKKSAGSVIVDLLTPANINNDFEPIEIFSSGTQAFYGPLIVIINNYTASCSELFATVMRESGRCLIVGGKRTFGKGVAQGLISTNIKFNDSFFIKNKIVNEDVIFNDVFGRITNKFAKTVENNCFHVFGVPADIYFNYNNCQNEIYINSFKENSISQLLDPRKIDKTCNVVFQAKSDIFGMDYAKNNHFVRKAKKLDGRFAQDLWASFEGNVVLDNAIIESINIARDLIIFSKNNGNGATCPSDYYVDSTLFGKVGEIFKKLIIVIKSKF